MVGLLDITPLTKKVSLGDGVEPLDVQGVSVKGFAHLFTRFPELRMLMSGEPVSRETLFNLAPEAMAAIIAAATGYPGDDRAETIASALPLELQLDILEAGLEITFRKGVTPFLERVNKWAVLVEEQNAVVNTMKAPALKSELLSSTSSTEDIPKKPSSKKPPANSQAGSSSPVTTIG